MWSFAVLTSFLNSKHWGEFNEIPIQDEYLNFTGIYKYILFLYILPEKVAVFFYHNVYHFF